MMSRIVRNKEPSICIIKRVKQQGNKISIGGKRPF